MRWHKSFQKSSPNQRKSPNPQTNQILISRQSHHSHTHSTELCHRHLHTKTQNSNEQEQRIIKESSKHVIVFVLKLACIDLIKQLHKNKSLKDHRIHLNFIGWIIQSNLLARVRIDVGLIRVERRRLVKRKIE